MRRSRLVLLALSTLALGAAIAPGTAAAACPLGPAPVWADYASVGVYGTPVASILSRPNTLLGVSRDDWAQDYQADGADTAGWHMQLTNLVGPPTSPKPKSQVLSRISDLAALARSTSACDPAWLTLNEMVTIQAPEPLSYGRRRYRENVLLLAKELKAEGVRVFILMPRIPLPSTRYTSYWRQLSLHANLVYEAYTWSSRTAISLGDTGGRRYLRNKWTEAMKRLKHFTVTPGRAGIMIPYWTHNKGSGREGLSDTAWFRLTRIKTLAVGDVARAQGIGTVWSWGWQTNPNVGEVDPDKPKAACVYLNTRDPALCDPSSL